MCILINNYIQMPLNKHVSIMIYDMLCYVGDTLFSAMTMWIAVLVCQSVHHCGPENTSTNVWWIFIKLCIYIHGPLQMNLTDCCDTITPVSPRKWQFSERNILTRRYWHRCFCRHSWFPETSHWLNLLTILFLPPWSWKFCFLMTFFNTTAYSHTVTVSMSACCILHSKAVQSH